MYNQFVALYDHIFPLKEAQRRFVLRQRAQNNRFLDIGCSTGALAASLATEFSTLFALDYSQEMVDTASERTCDVTYLQGDMKALPAALPGGFDTITCFGNTLVHLSSETEIASFFKSVKALLAPDGSFLFQIINYDRILQQRPEALPVIDNEKVRFTRLYHYDALPHIRFDTTLLDKQSGREITGEVPLLAIRSESIRALLLESGFTGVSFWGSFDEADFCGESYGLVVKAW